MAKRHDLEILQGATWSFVYTHLDSAGSAVDLTGFTARCSIKTGYGNTAEAYLSTGSDANGGTLTLGGANGTVTFAMTAAQTKSLLDNSSLLFLINEQYPVTVNKTFIYDLELVDGSGTVTRALEGRVIVQREVTG